jgi:threonine dehydrogenase-like Zn-dependent dehydrogenase
MKRVEKRRGEFNIVVSDVDRPQPVGTEVLIRAEKSLISRGSELWRRYCRAEAIDHDRMGYSLTGTITEVGDEVEQFAPGDRVAAVAPHAEYVAVDVEEPRPGPTVVHLPDEVSMEAGTVWPLATSAVLWIWTCDPGNEETVVVQGQGLVGSLCMQVASVDTAARVVAIDALPLRCALAERLGADAVVDLTERDPVTAVDDLTDGGGAEVVIEAVGGPAGVEAFDQAQDMVASGGLLQVLGLYEDEPLPLDSRRIQNRRLVGGYLDPSDRSEASDRALALLAGGDIETAEMITHRFDGRDAADAFDFLYERPEDALGVLLVWQ